MNTEMQSMNPDEFQDPFEHLDVEKEELEDLEFSFEPELPFMTDLTVKVTNRYRVKDITMEAYKALDGVRQSTLKKVFDDPSNILDETDEKNDGMKLGSLVDSMVSGTFDDEYIVGGDITISDTMKTMIEDVYQIQKQNELVNGASDFTAMDEEIILTVRDKYAWNTRYGNDAVISNFKSGGNKGTSAGTEYFNFLRIADGKTVITQSSKEVAQELVEHIKVNYGEIVSNCDKQVAYVGDITITHGKQTVSIRAKGLIDIDTPERIYDLKIIGRDLTMFGPGYYEGYGYKYQDTLYYLLTGKPFFFMAVSTQYPQAKFLRSAMLNEKPDIIYYDNIISHTNERDRVKVGLATLISHYNYYKKNGFTIPKAIRDNPVSGISRDNEKYTHLVSEDWVQ